MMWGKLLPCQPNQTSLNVNREILTLIRAKASIVDEAVLQSISAIFKTFCLIWISNAMYVHHGDRNGTYYKYCC